MASKPYHPPPEEEPITKKARPAAQPPPLFVELNPSDCDLAEWADDALKGIGKGAPFSLCLTQKHFSEVASGCQNKEHHFSKLNGVMKIEYRIALRSSLRNDFYEGVRAVLVDKDQNPKWVPPRVEDVDMEEVEAVFASF